MQNITRRAALGGIASVSAVGAAGTAFAHDRPEMPELPSERVVRLARELSKALDDLNRDAYEVDYGGDDVGIWIAHVWPSRINPHVALVQKDIPASLARFAAVLP